MLETGTGPVHLGQIFLINVLNIKKILAILPKQPRQVKMVEKLGKINRLFLHNEEKALGTPLPWGDITLTKCTKEKGGIFQYYHM